MESADEINKYLHEEGGAREEESARSGPAERLFMGVWWGRGVLLCWLSWGVLCGVVVARPSKSPPNSTRRYYRSSSITRISNWDFQKQKQK